MQKHTQLLSEIRKTALIELKNTNKCMDAMFGTIT